MADEVENEFDETVEDAAKLITTKMKDGEPVPKPVAKPEKTAKTEMVAAEEETQEETEEQPEETYEEETPSEDEEVNIDDIELDVLVDGENKKVTIKELKNKYSFTGAVDKRLQEVTEGRQKVAQQANALHNLLGQSAARLQALDKILAEAEDTDVDLDELRIKDPTRYLFEKERIREVQERRRQIAFEQQKITRQQQELQQDALIRHSQDEARKLAEADPVFADPRTAEQAMDFLMEGAAIYKFTKEEVAKVADHRALLVLRDALLYRQQKAHQNNTKKEAKTVPKQLLKPSVSSTKGKMPGTVEAKRMEALRAQARKSGHPDDIAATLIMRRGKR